MDYENYLEERVTLLLKDFDKPGIGKDLFDPVSYFFLDQFCRGMYSKMPGSDVTRLAQIVACRNASDFEEYMIKRTGGDFEVLGVKTYETFAKPDSHLGLSCDGDLVYGAALYVAKKLGREDYCRQALSKILESGKPN